MSAIRDHDVLPVWSIINSLNEFMQHKVSVAFADCRYHMNWPAAKWQPPGDNRANGTYLVSETDACTVVMTVAQPVVHVRRQLGVATSTVVDGQATSTGGSVSVTSWTQARLMQVVSSGQYCAGGILVYVKHVEGVTDGSDDVVVGHASLRVVKLV